MTGLGARLGIASCGRCGRSRIGSTASAAGGLIAGWPLGDAPTDSPPQRPAGPLTPMK